MGGDRVLYLGVEKNNNSEEIQYIETNYVMQLLDPRSIQILEKVTGNHLGGYNVYIEVEI